MFRPSFTKIGSPCNESVFNPVYEKLGTQDQKTIGGEIPEALWKGEKPEIKTVNPPLPVRHCLHSKPVKEGN